MPLPKPTSIGPLTGALDLRSEPDQLPQSGLRMRQNFRTVGDGKLRRGTGFEKLLNVSDYNNSDFHDQLLSLSGATIRQPVNFLYEAIAATRQTHFLLIGTQGTLAQLNVHTGNYRILGNGYGGTPTTDATAPRFKAGQQGDYIIFTNDFDKPKYTVIEQAPQAGQFVFDIPDLDTIGLRRAKLVWVWKNIVILANVEMDSQRVGNRIVWGDFDNPISFDPANLNSIAGFKDLDSYETILAGAPFGNSFLIYTTHSIWEMVADPNQIFDFRKIYDGANDKYKAVIKFPNSLVPIHDGHCYAAADGIYFFTQYSPVPSRPEWIHLGDADLFANVDSDACEVHVGFIYGDDLYYSFAKIGDTNHCPSYTLRINKTYKACDVVDTGFVTGIQFSPQDIPTNRDFIVENAICSLAGLAAAGYGYSNEGLPRTLPSASVPFNPGYFYTNIAQNVNVGGSYTVRTEDWYQPYAYAYSLCYLLGDTRLDETCQACKPTPILIAVSSLDWCIKQLTDVFYREICLNPTAIGSTDSTGYAASIGSYELNGIESILRFAGANLADSEVLMDQLELKGLAVFQDPPSTIGLRIGISAQPADSNTGEGIVWFQHSSKTIAFQTAKTMVQHLADNTIPSERLHWHFYRKGRFVHVELSISGVGGDALFGSIEGELKAAGRTYNY